MILHRNVTNVIDSTASLNIPPRGPGGRKARTIVAVDGISSIHAMAREQEARTTQKGLVDLETGD